MPGPGEYLPDSTEGITRVEDLPKPKIIRRKRDRRRRPCPHCGHRAYRDRRASACCTTWGIWCRAVPTRSISRIRFITVVRVANTSMRTCRTWPCQSPTTRTAWSLWPSVWSSKTACLTKLPVGTYGGIIGCLCPLPPSRTGWRPGGKKAEARVEADYLNWALADYSGYIAADELYDGPYCVLSIVDNRTFKRVSYRVLDHDPTHDDIREFFSAFRLALEARGLVLQGIPPTVRPCIRSRLPRFFPLYCTSCPSSMYWPKSPRRCSTLWRRFARNWNERRSTSAVDDRVAPKPSARRDGTGGCSRRLAIRSNIGICSVCGALSYPCRATDSSADHPRLAASTHSPPNHG